MLFNEIKPGGMFQTATGIYIKTDVAAGISFYGVTVEFLQNEPATPLHAFPRRAALHLRAGNRGNILCGITGKSINRVYIRDDIQAVTCKKCLYQWRQMESKRRAQ